MNIIIKWIISILLSIYKIPQIIKIFHSKIQDSLSFISLIIEIFINIFFIYDGYINLNVFIYIISIILILQNILLLCFYFYFKKLKIIL